MTKSEAKTRLAKLRQVIDQYRYDYHVLDKSTISEAALDSLKHELHQLEEQFPDLITPDSPSQRVAGQPLPAFKKVTHATRMSSLVDVFSFDELREWDERWKKLRPRQTTDYLVDLKLDGLAMTLVYERGLFHQAATRGDGFVGEDVTQNIKTIEAVPLHLRTSALPLSIRQQVQSGRVEIRGEVVMLKNDFQALNKRQTSAGLPTYANPRNVAAGSIRQLDPQVTAGRKLDFYAWELVTDLGQATLWSAHKLMRKMGIKVNPKSRLGQTLEEIAKFHSQMGRQRQSLPFWIDGVVVKINNRSLYQDLGLIGKTPRAAVAWKFSAEQATTVVEDIVVQVGRTGAITPVARLRPIQVAGTTVARATLHNADEIARLDLQIGDTVVIQKAGDIIPEVVEVLVKLRPAGAKLWHMPSHCPVCRRPLRRKSGEAIHYCTNTACPARHRENLYHLVSKSALDIDGLGPSTIDLLVEEGLIHEPADLWKLKTGDVVGLPLFADKKAENLISGITARREVTFERFLFGLGIRHVGRETARVLAQHFQTYERLCQASLDDLERASDVGVVVAKSIYEFFQNKKTRAIADRLARVIIIKTVRASSGGPLRGKSVVVTGTLPTLSREEIEEHIRRAGGKATGSVSKKTSYVVVGAEPGSKAERAKTLGVPILNETQFRRLLKL
ncbi:MAG: NAD-dependent DNA ligase LigA [Candidatus Kerfeldbacteria bacterium]|nr:NAD-dependent DNA ligase LigA [Candidatus Kerfeldbacteria bacterium]